MQLRFLALAAMTVVSTPSVHAGTVNFTTANTPTCTADQVARLNQVSQRQLGLDVKDPDGHYIGTYEGDGTFTNNWEPIDSYKHAFCGVLSRYSFYDPWGDEDDSNINLIPNLGFAGLLFSPADWGYTTRSDLKKCPDPFGPACLEAEITPPDPYPDQNPWFPHYASGVSTLQGQTVCAYGPWVADHGHGGRPEIHPAEARWWRVSPAEHRVHLMQDDSHRYSDRSDDFTPDMPSHIRPWAGTPRTAYVRQAFLLPQSGSAPVYVHVYEGSTYRVTTNENSSFYPDATLGTQHTLAYNGVARITVVEHQPDNNLGVVFDEIPNTPINPLLPPLFQPETVHDVCRRADGNLQGFVTLRTQFGKLEQVGNSTAAITGYQDLIIRHTDNLVDVYTPLKSFPTPSPDITRLSMQGTKVDQRSLRVERSESRMAVHGDLLIELEESAAISAVSYSSGEKIALEITSHNRNGGGTVVRLRDVELAAEQSLRIEFATGETITNPLPGLALTTDLIVAPQDTDAKPQGAQQLDSAWRSLIRHVGGAETARPASFAYAERWMATALPIFAARKDGKPSWEDSFEVVQLLNEAAIQGQVGALSMDAAAKALAWTSSGKSDDTRNRWEYAVGFSDASLLRSDNVTLQVTDVFGGEVKKERRIWSHVLRGDARALASMLPALIADLAALERSKSSAGDRAEPRPSDDVSYSEIALRKRALERLYGRSSRDGIVTPDELKALLDLAREVETDRMVLGDSESH